LTNYFDTYPRNYVSLLHTCQQSRKSRFLPCPAEKPSAGRPPL